MRDFIDKQIFLHNIAPEIDKRGNGREWCVDELYLIRQAITCEAPVLSKEMILRLKQVAWYLESNL